MSAKAVELANAIVTRLNVGGSYSATFSATRRTVRQLNVELLSDIQVSIVTGTTSTEQIARNRFEHVYKPIVFIHKKISADEATGQDESDALQQLVTEIESRLAGVDLASLSFVGFEEGAADRPTYDGDDMKRFGVFSVAIQLTYTD